MTPPPKDIRKTILDLAEKIQSLDARVKKLGIKPEKTGDPFKNVKNGKSVIRFCEKTLLEGICLPEKDFYLGIEACKKIRVH